MVKTKEVDVVDDNKEVATIEAQLREEAADLAASLGNITDKIVTQNKAYKLPNGTVLGPVMEAVILGFVDSSSYYENEIYDANNIQEPICFADAKGTQIKAPAKSIDKPMAATCPECPHFAYETSATGKGKRCKEEYKLALIPDGETEPMVLSIPPTGRRAFAKTMNTLVSAYTHPIKARVTFEFNPAVQYSQPIITNAEPNPAYLDHSAKVQDAIAELIRK